MLVQNRPTDSHVASPESSPTTATLGFVQPADEAELVARLRAGDQSAFAELVEQHTSHLAAVARRYLACEADVDDAVQEAFAAAFSNIDRFKGDARLSTWLHRIVVNAALMSRRKRMRRREVLGVPPDLSAARDVVARSDSCLAQAVGEPGERANARTEARRVLQHIRRLPTCHREVLETRHVQQQSTEQAAMALGITPGALKTRLHRAKTRLLRSLGD
ncbi:MAG: sigma-70 family RNA polymerase sigma factor [Phycisphaerales bacterium]|nr:sigma-70 family RNA polymerase sigma factor [Phycisphaerales bacterium]